MKRTSLLFRGTSLFLVLALLVLTLPQSAHAEVGTVDAALPSFSLSTTDGRTITDDDFIGKTSIIIFSRLNGASSSCYNTDSIISGLLGSPLASYGVQMVAVDISNSSLSTVTLYQETNDPRNLLTYCINGQNCVSAFLKILGFSSFSTPLIVLVDKDGRIRNYTTGNQSSTKITNLLHEFDSSIPTETLLNLLVRGIAHYSDANDVTDNVNRERREQGLDKLEQDYYLTELAMQRAAEIAIYYSHTRPNGQNCASILEGVAGENAVVGENIAYVASISPDADGVMDAWMNSEGHRANILESRFRSIGVGCFSTGQFTYWVQIFSSDKSTRTPNTSSLSHKTYQVETRPNYVNLDTYTSELKFRVGEADQLKFYNKNPQISIRGYEKCAELDPDCLTFSVSGNLMEYDSDGSVMPLKEGSGSINVRIRTDVELSTLLPRNYSFTVVSAGSVGGDPTTKPSSYLPKSGKTDFGTYHEDYVSFSDLAITFPTKVKILSSTDYKAILNFDAGSIRIVDTSTGKAVWTAHENSFQENTCSDVSVSSTQTVFHIIPTNCDTLLSPGVTYRVEVDAGVICFEDGTTNAAITDWTFTTVSKPHYPAPLEKSGTFQYYSHLREMEKKSNTEASYTYNYNENWFFQNNDTYNHDLAKMSLRMATCASETNANHIVTLLENLEYSNAVYHFPSPTPDTIGYAIASKQVENANGEQITLIAVVIRSGAYEAEWASNFEVGVASEHAGFAKAGSTVYNAVKDYIANLDDPENIKIWLSGYSRGAATANIAAQRLSADGKYGRIDGLSASGIYAYCFACPLNVTTETPGAKLEYKGLFNIIAYNDLVAKVAPESWGFTRYGTTLILPSAELSYTGFNSKNTAMKNRYQTIAQKAGASTSTVEDATDFLSNQGAICNTLLDSLVVALYSQSVYVSECQDIVMELTDYNLTLTDVLMYIVAFLASPPTYILNDTVAEPIEHAHFHEHYMAWMDTISSVSDFCNEQNSKPNGSTGKFADVSVDAYYNTAVSWAVDNQVTTGTDDTHFSPDAVCTRAQLVVFLWRAMGKPEPKSNVNGFTDVPNDSYYTKAVLWASQNGITTGTDKTHFSPNAVVTRAQAVTFLYRTYNGSNPGISNPFYDVSRGVYYYEPVLWAYSNGITTGTDKTHFSPDDSLTRAQAVTFLYRAATK